MSVIISPIITNAGLGVFTPSATGIEFTFTHVAVGTGTSAVTAAATALENEIARFLIAGGGIVTGGQAVSINALITNHANANPQDYDITEFGFYGVDSNTNIVLFAIYRTNTTIVSKVSGADIAVPFVMGLAALPTNNMTVQIDTNTSQTLALMGQHTAANNPHPQYKRILDNTERLKIATAVDADDAIRKDELDALRLRLIANGIDADLAWTNAYEVSDLNEFVSVGEYYVHLLNSVPFPYGLVKVKRENENVVYQQIQGAGDAGIATRYGNRVSNLLPLVWTNWRYYASLNGDANEYFHVKTAVNDDHAPTFKQLVDGLNAEATVRANADTNLQNTKANLGGSNTQRFKIEDAVDNDEAVSKEQLDAVESSIPTLPSIATTTVAGIVEKATQAEMNAGTANVWPDAQTILNGFSFDSANKEFKLSEFFSGISVKMGTVTTGNLFAGNNPQTVVFNTPFPNNCLMFFAVPKTSEASDTPNFWVSVNSFSASSAVVWLFETGASDQGAGAGFNWLAIGY